MHTMRSSLSTDQTDHIMSALGICPLCRAPIDIEQFSNECRSCGGKFLTRHHVSFIPQTLPSELQSKADLWTTLQKNGEISYRIAPELNLIGQHDTAAQLLAERISLNGTILDIGCGPQQEIPAYAQGRAPNSIYVGIDPLPGFEVRDFPFLNALAELLPFADGSFDHVIFASCLDHMIDYRAALREGVRVLKPGGKVHILIDPFEGQSQNRSLITMAWNFARRATLQIVRGIRILGVKRLAEYINAMRSLTTPKGAMDYFHIYFPSVPEVHNQLETLGVRARSETQVKHWSYISGTRSAAS